MSRNLKTLAQVEIHPSAEEVAKVFWAMDAEEQAEFFNTLHDIAYMNGLPMQLQFLTDNKHLKLGGRLVMEQFGEYAKTREG